MTSQLLTTAQIIGITGEEDPLTPADIRLVLERAYTPWQAALMLRGPRTAWGREATRPPHKGGAGRDGDDTYVGYGCDGRGIHARVIDGEVRAGFIAWRDAEQAIRDAATPATLAALCEAVDAYRAHLARRPEPRPGQSAPPLPEEEFAEGARLMRAETAAWRALIRAETAEQLGLFGQVA